MDQLKDMSFRYLPRTLIEHWAENPDIRPVWGEWLYGSLMHCDVTGFTAMSEKLAEVGKEGAELMAGVLNQFFERMLAIAVSWGGIQMKFGGDAMLLYFPGEDHAQRSAACGLEMQSAMCDFKRIKVKDDYHKLLMRIGIHSGRFFVCSVGQVGTKIGQGEGRLHYYIVGKDVSKSADTEPMAEPGQVVVSDTTYHLINDVNNKITETDHKNIWLVKKIKAKKQRLKFFDDDALPYHVLERYMLKPIAEGMSSGKSEHRRVTIIFIYLTGIAELLENYDEEIALSQLNSYTNLIIETAEKYGGYFSQSDASEHGDKLILMFGAPVMHDSQETSAMHFALEIKEKKELLNINLEHHIGINTGYVFCGEIGSTVRREYTAIGDSMNLAARLMAAAGVNEIIVSNYTANNAKEGFEIDHLEPIMVKGKKDPIPICRLKGFVQDDSGFQDIEKNNFYGRKKELGMLDDFYMSVKEQGSKGLLLYGEPGVGKTAIVAEFMRKNKSDKNHVEIFCRSYDKNSAYSGIRQLIYNLINTSENEKDPEQSIKNLVKKYANDYLDFIPLIEEILGLDYKDNSITASIDARTRRDKRLEILVEIVSSYSDDNPLVVLVDNAQWIDSTSAEVFSGIINNNISKVFFIATARQEEDLGPLPDKLAYHKYLVENLPRQDAIKLITDISSINDHSYLESIFQKTQGNPLFLIELINTGNIEEGELPDSLYDIVMAKMDRLKPEYKYFLQSASVIGTNIRSDEMLSVI